MIWLGLLIAVLWVVLVALIIADKRDEREPAESAADPVADWPLDAPIPLTPTDLGWGFPVDQLDEGREEWTS